VGEDKPFSIFKRQYVENGRRYTVRPKLITNWKLHERFQLTPRPMTLDDLDLL